MNCVSFGNVISQGPSTKELTIPVFVKSVLSKLNSNTLAPDILAILGILLAGAATAEVPITIQHHIFITPGHGALAQLPNVSSPNTSTPF